MMAKRTRQPRLFTEMDKREEYERALFTAICTACEYPFGQLTKTARGRVNEAVKEIVETKGTVKEVATVARGMLAEYGHQKFITPQGIVGNWPKFVGGTAADRRLKKEREKQQREDVKKASWRKRALSLSSDEFDDVRNRLLALDHGIMRVYLLDEPATQNTYLLEEMGKLLDAKGKR